MPSNSDMIVRIEADAAQFQRTVAAAQQQLTAASRSMSTNVQQLARGTQVNFQNLSYQLQDIGVQLSMGQSPLMVMIQQGPQVVDALGGINGALTAVGKGLRTVGGIIARHPLMTVAAVLGGAAVAMGLFSSSTDDAATAQVSYEDAMRRSNELLLTQAELTKQAAEEKRKQARETVLAALALERENAARAQQALDLNLSEAARLRDEQRFLPGTANTNFLQDPIQRSIDKIREAELRIANLEKALADLDSPKAGSVLAIGLAGGAGAARQVDELAEAQRRAREALSNLNEVLRRGDEAFAPYLAKMKEGARITEAMRTPAEVYAEDLDTLNDLLAVGAINQETYNRAVRAAQVALERAGQATAAPLTALQQTLIQGFQGLTSEILNSRSALHALGNVAERVLTRILDLGLQMAVINPLLNSAFGLTGSQALPTFGAPRPRATGGGASAGTLYKVNEHGTEYFKPNVGGTIIPMGGVSAPAVSVNAPLKVVVNNMAPGTEAGARERRGAGGLRELEVWVKQAARGAVTEMVNTGGLDRDLGSNFGIGRTPTRR